MPRLLFVGNFRTLTDGHAGDFGSDDVGALLGVTPNLLSEIGIASGDNKRKSAADRPH